MNNAQQVIQACRDVARAAKSLHVLSSQVSSNNSAKKLDWTKADVINAEAEGVAIEQIDKCLKAIEAFDADFWATHGETFEVLCPPIV